MWCTLLEILAAHLKGWKFKTPISTFFSGWKVSGLGSLYPPECATTFQVLDKHSLQSLNRWFQQG